MDADSSVRVTCESTIQKIKDVHFDERHKNVRNTAPGGKTTKWWCAICGEKYDWRQPNRLLVVQTGESFDQAKVFKAHAVPQDLCANFINALKLLANQQGDGDGLLESIVKDLGKESHGRPA